jgi:signal transduction histidine kinase
MENLTDFMSEAEDVTGRGATLSEYVEKLSEKMMHLSGGGLNITMDGTCDYFDEEVTYQLNGIISEAVANAIRHAKATEIKIQCRQDPLGTTICVENDGLPLPDRYQEGMGLPLMRHRAMSIGGSLRIEGGPGQRTRLTCTVPPAATADKKAFPKDGQRLHTTA